jgi:2-polyprenyl-3-methyl-5-hydroxy-6-metoxy-1,4-benzoquinol methylase
MQVSYSHCPICNHATLTPLHSVPDFSVTQQVFPLVKCTQCTLVLTQQVPDAANIAPYYAFSNYISHTDTQKGIINKLYHWVRKRTLKRKLALLKKHTAQATGSALDIGSGTGAFLNAMQQAQWQVQGLEPDAGARQIAHNLYNIDTQSSEALFHLMQHQFNAITLWHVLEHVHALNDYMALLPKLLKPNGRIFIAVPNYTSYDAAYYKTHWAAYDVPRHLYHFSPQSIQELATQNGLVVEAIKPMWFDSFYVSMLSEKYKKGSILRAFFIALISNCKTLVNTQKCSSLIYILKTK